jgi:hypothetical protein
MPYIQHLVKFREESFGYGGFWKGLDLREGDERKGGKKEMM